MATWLDALAPGRIILPLTVENRGGSVLKVTRLTIGYSARFISQVGIFPCAGARTPRANYQLKAAFQSGTQNTVRSLGGTSIYPIGCVGCTARISAFRAKLFRTKLTQK